jgi:Cytochrome b5-like Heme/Steroid binding domain
MWFMWVALMMTIVVTVRYYKHYWRRLIWVHVITGTLIMLVTTAAALMAWIRLKKRAGHFMNFSDWPSLLENVATYIAWLVSITGLVGFFYRYCGKYEWGTLRMQKIMDFHKLVARIFVIGVQGLITMAIMDNFGFTRASIFVASFQLFSLILIFVLFEIRHQNILKQREPYVKCAVMMDLEEFERRVRGGEMLMILDDLVLDVGEFYLKHPGGKFVIEHTVGTDIAKFFYGGYCLEDNGGKTPAKTWTHTNYARMIANDLAIARFDCQRDGSEESWCRLRFDLDNSVNKLTRTFTMETADRKPRYNYKQYYPGLKYLTKHFWIRNMSQPDVIRHYTTCNAMRAPFYNELVRCLRDASVSDTFDKSLLDDKDNNSMVFTIKNYKQVKGLSYKFFENDQRAEYQMKGPMGKGLAPSARGIHIAFAAGTGALCFVDIMAHIALAVMG